MVRFFIQRPIFASAIAIIMAGAPRRARIVPRPPQVVVAAEPAPAPAQATRGRSSSSERCAGRALSRPPAR